MDEKKLLLKDTFQLNFKHIFLFTGIRFVEKFPKWLWWWASEIIASNRKCKTGSQPAHMRHMSHGTAHRYRTNSMYNLVIFLSGKWKKKRKKQNPLEKYSSDQRHDRIAHAAYFLHSMFSLYSVFIQLCFFAFAPQVVNVVNLLRFMWFYVYIWTIRVYSVFTTLTNV